MQMCLLKQPNELHSLYLEILSWKRNLNEKKIKAPEIISNFCDEVRGSRRKLFNHLLQRSQSRFP